MTLEFREFTADRFPRTLDVLQSGVNEKVAPGFVAGLWQKTSPHLIQGVAVGHRRLFSSQVPQFSPPAMTLDTIFDLASLTKIFATAPLAAVLVERGWLDWDDSVSLFFPYYPYSGIQIKHLLSHSAGFVAWEPFWQEMRREFSPKPLETLPIEKRQKKMRELVLAQAPQFGPGVQTVYSDLSFLILGFILEEITGMPLDRAVHHFVWKPMGMKGPYFNRVVRPVHQEQNERVAATEVGLPGSGWREGLLQGQVHDDNCWAMGGFGGHAGVFGTLTDLLHFIKKMMEGFHSPEILRAIWTPVANSSRTLGWDMPSGEHPSIGRFFSRNSVGHLGFTGTSLWIDLEAEVGVVLLSNRVHPSRENLLIREFRPRFHEAIWQDLQ